MGFSKLVYGVSKNLKLLANIFVIDKQVSIAVSDNFSSCLLSQSAQNLLVLETLGAMLIEHSYLLVCYLQ